MTRQTFDLQLERPQEGAVRPSGRVADALIRSASQLKQRDLPAPSCSSIKIER